MTDIPLRYYHPEAGDEFIAIADIGPEHHARIFEARNQKTGEGIIGYLEDANHYLLDGVVAIRFRGEKLGIFEQADARILLKHPDYVHPGLTPPPPRHPDPVLPH